MSGRRERPIDVSDVQTDVDFTAGFAPQSEERTNIDLKVMRHALSTTAPGLSLPTRSTPPSTKATNSNTPKHKLRELISILDPRVWARLTGARPEKPPQELPARYALHEIDEVFHGQRRSRPVPEHAARHHGSTAAEPLRRPVVDRTHAINEPRHGPLRHHLWNPALRPTGSSPDTALAASVPS